MMKFMRTNLRIVAWAALVATLPANAAPILLASEPASASGRYPAPNILLSVDDSGSMDWEPGSSSYPTGSQKSRMYYLKKALTDIFLNPSVIAPDSIRLGFQAMHRCNGFGPSASRPSNFPACPENRLKKFSGAHREGFRAWVNNLEAGGGTPSHSMFTNVDKYMKSASGLWDPFLPSPGDSATGEKLSCRRTYHIFMTDGEWNNSNSGSEDAPGNADGNPVTLPDGVLYSPFGGTDPQTNIYRDTYAPRVTDGSRKATLADWAFKMWSTDYSTLPNDIKPLMRVNTPETFGTVSVNPYWNPRNNPMTWQGVTTHTIGFGPPGNLPTSGPGRPWWGVDQFTGGDVNNLFAGTVSWANPLLDDYNARRQELWHAALNGRGQFLPSTDGAYLVQAFKNIIEQVFRDNANRVSGTVSNTQSIRTGSLGFVSSYNPADWSGELQAFAVMPDGTLSSSPAWTASSLLNNRAPADRRIFTYNITKNSAVPFTWDMLSTFQQTYFSTGGDAALGQARVNFIRGVRTGEGSKFRARGSVLGDIVNSSPWTVKTPNMGYVSDSYLAFRAANASREEMVYVGSNDGMLHGFSENGSERFAYIPRGAYVGAQNGIRSTTEPSYTHRYFVDGAPFSADYESSSNTWKTVLVGTMGLGGRGFFAIDVTRPSSWNTDNPTVAASNILFDKTESFTPSAPVGLLPPAQWADIGHITTPVSRAPGNPNRVTQIAKLNNNRWALLIGNGANSGNEQASLLIQFLDGNRELVKIVADATIGDGNGLSSPTAIDLDGDHRVDVVYAGDLKGNLWKFDLSSSSASGWKVSFGSQPLFKASIGSQYQPITTAPTYVTNVNGGVNLVFATGRNMAVLDPNNRDKQTVYSVWDNSQVYINRNADGSIKNTKITDGTKIAGRPALLERKVVNVTLANKGSFGSTDSTATVNYTGPGVTHRGWYFDLPASGERGIDNSMVVTKSLVYIPSVQPAVGNSSSGEGCEFSVKQAYFGLFLDGVTGLPYMRRPLFDSNGDNNFDNLDVAGASRIYLGTDPAMIINNKGTTSDQRFSVVPSRSGSTDPSGGICQTDGCGGYKKAGADGKLSLSILYDRVRIGWRQLQ